MRELRGKGLSTRAIADVVGVSHPTIISDLKAGGKGLPPAEQSKQESEPCESDKPSSATSSSDSAPAMSPKVNGKDGKKYPAKSALIHFATFAGGLSAPFSASAMLH